MEIPTKAEVPDMLRAAWDLASTLGPLAPAVLRSEDVAVIAAHIGATAFERRPHDGGFSFKCPACGEWDFGPTETLHTAVNVWLRGGRLPSAPLLGGACLGCEHITSPAGVEVDPDEVS